VGEVILEMTPSWAFKDAPEILFSPALTETLPSSRVPSVIKAILPPPPAPPFIDALPPLALNRPWLVIFLASIRIEPPAPPPPPSSPSNPPNPPFTEIEVFCSRVKSPWAKIEIAPPPPPACTHTPPGLAPPEPPIRWVRLESP